jgi:hypothetical protein
MRKANKLTTCVLEEANAAVNGRVENYGTPQQNFSRIADFWNVAFAEKLAIPLTPEDVALALSLLKISRLVQTPHHHDSLVDLAGYAECYGQLAE